ncbi:diguanylate cyclase domain-containing protein [Variovorax sp. KK3]|uniref:diguanylate cyclase domain-containing protein n=1 Tax=Variovorax sp. KK3 TaxID=1855728 RepID=UPI00097C09DC|nr:diguanylate cyclase [Variovorax sp. KK3]
MQKPTWPVPRIAGALATMLVIAFTATALRPARSQAAAGRHKVQRDLVTVFEHTTDYVVQADSRGRIHYMNPALRHAQGIGRDAPMDGVDVTIFNTPETNRLFVDTILPAARDRGVWIGETTIFVAGGRELHVDQMVIAHKGPDGRVGLYSSIMRDISDQIALRHEQQRLAASLRSENVHLLKVAQRDPLTGLLNRLGFEVMLEEHRDTRSLSLLYIDLDRFKPVNDTHGHAVGDELLQHFALRLQMLAQPFDAVARLGGDEFAIALTGDRSAGDVDAMADRVVQAAHEPFELAGGLRLHIGASVGIALGADAPPGWPALIAHADRMLYRAKAAGRGRHAREIEREAENDALNSPA